MARKSAKLGIVGFYSRYILPNIISCGCGMRSMREKRQALAPRAAGVVRKLGLGSGHNLPFYDPQRVTKVFGLEPEPGMLAKARRRVKKAAVDVELLPEKAENVSLPDGSVDTVLVTFSLCTIPDVRAALRGARRVLKPGGRLLFCEHGRSPDADVFARQQRLEPTWKRLFGGCHLTRDIPGSVRAAGFHIEELESGYMPKAPKVGGYVYEGMAAR